MRKEEPCAEDAEAEEEAEEEVEEEAEEEPPRKQARARAPAKPSVEEATERVLKAMSCRRQSKAAAKEARAKEGEEKGLMKRPAACGTASGEKPPSLTDERSRSQILFRTGCSGPGQSVVIKYTDERSKQSAIAKATAMVKKERQRRGLQ
eukprot:14576149-Alexandrium_andersonii.AAC.1